MWETEPFWIQKGGYCGVVRRSSILTTSSQEGFWLNQFGCIDSSTIRRTLWFGWFEWPLNLKTTEIEIENSEKKIKKYVPLSKRQDKPDSALWLIKHHSKLKDSQIAKLIGITSASVKSIRNKSHWNYNSLNPKDPVAMGLFSQKDLLDSLEKADRRIKREQKLKSN